MEGPIAPEYSTRRTILFRQAPGRPPPVANAGLDALLRRALTSGAGGPPAARNIVRANRVNENGGGAGCGCVGSSDSSSSGILVTGALSEFNEVVENEVVGNNGWGIRSPGRLIRR